MVIKMSEVLKKIGIPSPTPQFRLDLLSTVFPSSPISHCLLICPGYAGRNERKGL